MAEEQNISPVAEDAHATHAGSVYHMRDNRRKSPYPPRSPGRRPGRASTRKQSKSTNVGHAVLISHVRTFALVAVFMAGLLGLAVYITGRTWQRHITRARQSRAAGSPAESRPAATADEHGVGVVVTDGAGPMVGRARAELDTESMRRALVMQARAETLREEGRPEEALGVFQEALRIWPHLSQVWPQKGRIHLELGQYVRAEAALERAVEADPANVELLNDLGVSILYQNRIPAALALFEAVLELDAEFAPALFNQALGFMVLDNDAAAERAIDAFLALRPDDPAALKEKAYLQAAQSLYADALESLQAALAVAPEWAALYIDAAAVAALQGDAAGALLFLDGAEALTGPDVVFRILQQPAFRSVRLSEEGLDFQRVLGERARVQLTDEMAAAEVLAGSSPMASMPSPTVSLLDEAVASPPEEGEQLREE